MGADQVGTIIRGSETFTLRHDSGIFCPTSPGMSGCSPMSRCIQHRSFARFQRGRAVVLATGTARRTSGTCALLLHFRAGRPSSSLRSEVYHKTSHWRQRWLAGLSCHPVLVRQSRGCGGGTCPKSKSGNPIPRRSGNTGNRATRHGVVRFTGKKACHSRTGGSFPTSATTASRGTVSQHEAHPGQ